MRLLAITLGIFIINNGYAVAATMSGRAIMDKQKNMHNIFVGRIINLKCGKDCLDIKAGYLHIEVEEQNK